MSWYKKDNEKIIKILGLNVGIGVVDTILFSPGLLGLSIIGGSAFASAFGITALVMSGVVFAVGNYKLLIEKDKVIQASEIKTHEDYINALEQNYNKKMFEKDINTILEQIETFKKKKETIRNVLLQKFDSTEMSYSKFDGVISDIENVFYLNIRNIINKLNSFDEQDYNRIRKDGAQKKFSEEFIRIKMRIYNEYILSIKKSIEDNEQIILKLDKILLELSKLNSIEEIENMSIMNEVDDLITKIKLYS